MSADRLENPLRILPLIGTGTPLLLMLLLLVPLASPLSGDEIDRVIDLLRVDPDDPVRLDGALRWASRGPGAAALAEALARSGRSRRDGSDLLLAARVRSASGEGASALGLLEEGLRLSPEDGRIRAALVAAWLDADWPQAAAEIAAVDDALDPLLALRLAAALGDLEAVEAQLTAHPTLAGSAAVVALLAAEDLPAVAARLAEEAGDNASAVALRIEAGDFDGAIAALEATTLLSTDDALTLARFSGSRRYLDRYRGPLTAGVRAQLEESWQRSLGLRRRLPVEEETVAGNPPRVSPGGSRIGIAEAIAAGLPSTPEDLATLEESAGPSLAVAAAWLQLGEEERARRQLALATLDGFDGDEERWRGILERRRPAWFSPSPSPTAVSSTLAAAVTATPELLSSARRAFAAATPGSSSEARLLFHIGRLTGKTALIERASRIAPGMWVTMALGAGDARFPLDPGHPAAHPAELRMGHVAASPAPGTRIGHGQTGPLRVPGFPPIGDSLHLQRIRLEGPLPDDSRGPRLDAAGVPRAPVVGADQLRAEAINGELLEAIAPLRASLSLSQDSWLIAGSGLAFLDRKGADIAVALVIRWPQKIDLSDLPAALRDALPEGARPVTVTADSSPFNRSLRGNPALWTFVEGAADSLRQRAGGPAIWVELDGTEEGAIEVRVAEQIVGTFTSAPSPFPPGGTLAPFAGVDRYHQEGLLWRRSPAPESPSIEAPPTRVAERLERVRTIELARNYGASNWLRPAPPAESVTHLATGERVIARAGRSPALAIGAGGTVAWYCRQGEAPLWLSPLLEAPLPGLNGFLAPWMWPGDVARSPGKTGPSSDAAYPWLWPATMADGHPRFVVTTDRAWIITEEGIETVEGVLPGGILDATVDGDGNAILLSRSGDRLLLAGEEIALKRSGVYDIEAVADGLLLLGRDGAGDHLSLLDGPSTTTLPLPDLAQEEDRADLRVAALGRWGNDALLLTRELWILEEGRRQWRLIIPWQQVGRRQEARWCQSPPRTVGDEVWIARPWGAIEVWRNP